MDRTKNRPVPAKRMSPNRGIMLLVYYHSWFGFSLFDKSQNSNVWGNFNIFLY
jgi:heme O synthase-like polyprenyltransferase